MKTIVNAAPGVVDYGVKDESTAPFTGVPEQIPQHLPKYLIFAPKGPSGLEQEQLLVGQERLTMYGEAAFAERSKYCNHQTLHSNVVNAEGNAAMYYRLIPPDAGPNPTIRVWLDVLATMVDDYERNQDGSIRLDVNGDPIVLGQVAGHRVKFVVDHYEDAEELETFGQLTQGPGDQVDGGNTSIRYPIFEQKHSFIGEDGNLAGIRLYAMTTGNSISMPTKLMNATKAYPYKYQVIRKNTSTGSAAPRPTIFNEQEIMVTFKPESIDPLTAKRVYFGDQVVEAYQNLTDSRYAKTYGEFGEVKVYQENIDLLLEMFHAAEVPLLNAHHDFTADPETAGLFNFVTGTCSDGTPYRSFVFVDAVNAVRFSSNTNVFAAGGSDGTMTHEMHAQLTEEYMERYASELDELNDVAYHVESHFYDTGFPLDTKYKLLYFIANRKDTFVMLSPFEYGERTLTQSEEYSVATALLSRLMLFPESSYFGTPVFRGMIVGCSGRLRNSLHKERLPLTFEMGFKSARYMGAGNGVWKNGFNFDGYPGSIVEKMYDISIKWVPDDVRNRLWDVGLNWVSRYDRKRFYFPANKTVYSNDTSVLTNYLTACAIIQLNKIAHYAHRTFSGTSGLTPAQFTQAVNDYVSDQVRGKFDDRYIIRPKAFFTDLDQVMNFSWTLPIEIYAPGMMTVMTAYVVSRRIQDYQPE